MRRNNYRPTYFFARRLQDGTILGAYPIRKPSSRVIKDYRIHIDEDNICQEYQISLLELRDEYPEEERFRYHDIIANNLNVLRAIRQHLLPRLDALETKIDAMKTQLDRIEQKWAAVPN